MCAIKVIKRVCVTVVHTGKISNTRYLAELSSVNFVLEAEYGCQTETEINIQSPWQPLPLLLCHYCRCLHQLRALATLHRRKSRKIYMYYWATCRLRWPDLAIIFVGTPSNLNLLYCKTNWSLLSLLENHCKHMYWT